MDKKKNSAEAEMHQTPETAGEGMVAPYDNASAMEDEYYGMLEDYWNDSYYAEAL